jgi:predicted sugar kinase
LQGGAYASSEVARLIEWLRAAGIDGVGQSSWGPLVFAFAPSEHAAREMQHRISAEYLATGLRCEITSALNAGAAIA